MITNTQIVTARAAKGAASMALRATVSALALCVAGAPAVSAQEAPLLLPGAPGEATRNVSVSEAVSVAESRFTDADVKFMQDMIPHHQQAVEMAALVADRTNTQEIIDLAGRIDASQEDEIAFMREWLEERGQVAPEPGDHSHHTHMSHQAMGMASPQQMAALAAASGTDFDRQFLKLMIPHHEGAVRMVRDLLGEQGSAYDPVLFEFVNDVRNDQTAEVNRMNALLTGLSDDPRVGLAAGFRTAGSAISNLALVASMPKPAGFFDPENPSGLPLVISRDDDGEIAEVKAAPEPDHAHHANHAAHAGHGAAAPADAAAPATPEPAERDEDDQANARTEWGARSPLLSFANTDMAFSGDVFVVGNYHGFQVYKLDANGIPVLESGVVCPGGQGDVSIVGDLLIMSVEQTRGRVDCGVQGVTDDVSAERFRGLRIFDISDTTRPVQVGQVQTCRGSHTHSVVSGPGRNGKIIVYNSGTAGVRDEEELEGCIGNVPGDERTALFRVDVIEIPVDDPSKARIIDSPAVFADPDSGSPAGLWQGGDHGPNTQSTNSTNHCHDITVFPAANIAAGACSGNGIIFDISNPMRPKRIYEVVDPSFAYWHSATFNNDGTKVLFTDEWGGGGRPRCRAADPDTWGANAFYEVNDGQLEFASYYKIPAPQSDEENCVAHNGSIIPVPGRDIFVQAWYQGGISIIDFTDAANPVEIGFFDRGPMHPERLALAGYWSVYWYNGRIYGTEIARGLDVFGLIPSEHLTEKEIQAASMANMGAVFNPQQQFPVSWPADPLIAEVYIEQLRRDGGTSDAVLSEVDAALARVSAALTAGASDRGLARDLDRLARGLPVDEAQGQAAKRLASLGETLEGLADRVR